jgi:hypothetical protein
VYSNSIFVSKFFKKKLYKNHPQNRVGSIFYNLIENYNISFDTVIFNSRVVKKLAQVLDPNFNLIHDLDLIIRLSKISQLRYCPKVLSYWRAHHSNTSNNAYLKFAEEKKIFEKKIINLYSKDLKLMKSLHQFRENYYVEECIGNLLKGNKLKARIVFVKIKNKKIKLLFLILSYIPFSNFLMKLIVYINKTVLLR